MNLRPFLDTLAPIKYLSDFPNEVALSSVVIVQSGDHILNTFDKYISEFAETKFQRQGITVKTGHRFVHFDCLIFSALSAFVGQ